MKKVSILMLIVILLSACSAVSTAPPQATTGPIVSTLPVVPTDTTQPTQVPIATAEPTQTAVPEPEWIAYIGNDGNLRLVDRLGGETRQLTTDAATYDESQQPVVQYWNPQWSSDGTLLAYQRDLGTPAADSGYTFTYELWVYQPLSETQQRLPVEPRALGIAWKPGTHLLAYAAAYDEGYFTMRGEVDSSKASGIWGVNVDTGESQELVPVQNGYSLRAPQWSREGRFLSFEEVWGYEGSGFFAYYDFEAQEYLSWGEAVGYYDWSPDSEKIVHDTLTYTPTGSERIYLRPRAGGEAQQFSPDYEVGYAFSPLYSPSGEQIAYLAEIGAMDSGMYTLFVQPVAGGEPRQLGIFEFGIYLSWLPDESGLVLAAGQFETRQILEVALTDGSVRMLADGDSPVLVP
jgi:Tol biopolymer transport system component